MGYGFNCECPDCGYTLVAFQGTGISKTEIDTEYKIFECEECGYYEALSDKGQHRCIRCRSQMRLIERFDEKLFGGEILCPNCHGYLEAKDILQEREWLTQSRYRTESERSVANHVYEIGSYLSFGCYPQGINGEIKPIEWQVLQTEQDKMLLISKYGLDNSCFHNVEEETNWEKCSLRSWLNRNFYNTAFTKLQQKQILATDIVVEESEVSHDRHTVQDHIFLLSLHEAKRILGYSSSKSSNSYAGIEVCEPTDYVVRFRKAWIVDGSVCWWLRSNGTIDSRAAYVERDYPDSAGEEIYEEYGVRPAMWISAPTS